MAASVRLVTNGSFPNYVKIQCNRVIRRKKKKCISIICIYTYKYIHKVIKCVQKCVPERSICEPRSEFFPTIKYTFRKKKNKILLSRWVRGINCWFSIMNLLFSSDIQYINISCQYKNIGRTPPKWLDGFKWFFFFFCIFVRYDNRTLSFFNILPPTTIF